MKTKQRQLNLATKHVCKLGDTTKNSMVANCLGVAINLIFKDLSLDKRAPRIQFAWHGKQCVYQQKGKDIHSWHIRSSRAQNQKATVQLI